jgi:hypothetical protein
MTRGSLDAWFRGRLRFLAARQRVPAPCFSRYIHHNTWHFCGVDQRDLKFDDERWIEVTW